MRRLLLLSAIFALVCPALADESYVGLFLADSPIGYTQTKTTKIKLNGKPAQKSESKTIMSTKLLGQDVSMRIDTTSLLDASGKIIRSTFRMESSGRTQQTIANFSGRTISLTIDNSGTKSTKTLTIPKGARVVDDAVGTLIMDGAKQGTSRTYYVLDGMTAQLLKNTVTLKGRAKTKVRGKVVEANQLELNDTRSITLLYLSSKGDFIKGEGPAGLTMIPLKKSEALALLTKQHEVHDFATETKIVPTHPIDGIDDLKALTLKISGVQTANLPSDEHQTATKSGSEALIVQIHPVDFQPDSVTIEEADKQQPDWIKPGLYIPSDEKAFTDLAQGIVGDNVTVSEAAKRVQSYVYHLMKPNAGIGVLRNASEILRTKEGVCRDYAILTATLLRAAKVPARLVSGLVYAQGGYYYHAWAEVWDGKNWVGVDSTRTLGKLTPGYIELAEGNVEEAYNFTLLNKVKVELLNATKG